MTYTREFRGTCNRCGFRHELLKDGTLARHKIYVGNVPSVCPGSHRPTADAELLAAKAALKAADRA